VVFGVNWGDPLATTVVVVLFCLIAGGAGMLVGRDAAQRQPGVGPGVGIGLGMAALGGSMVPLELFPDTCGRWPGHPARLGEPGDGGAGAA
jgi:ABC-2 type transport system permease protein